MSKYNVELDRLESSGAIVSGTNPQHPDSSQQTLRPVSHNQFLSAETYRRKPGRVPPKFVPSRKAQLKVLYSTLDTISLVNTFRVATDKSDIPLHSLTHSSLLFAPLSAGDSLITNTGDEDADWIAQVRTLERTSTYTPANLNPVNFSGVAEDLVPIGWGFWTKGLMFPPRFTNQNLLSGSDTVIASNLSLANTCDLVSLTDINKAISIPGVGTGLAQRVFDDGLPNLNAFIPASTAQTINYVNGPILDPYQLTDVVEACYTICNVGSPTEFKRYSGKLPGYFQQFSTDRSYWITTPVSTLRSISQTAGVSQAPFGLYSTLVFNREVQFTEAFGSDFTTCITYDGPDSQTFGIQIDDIINRNTACRVDWWTTDGSTLITTTGTTGVVATANRTTIANRLVQYTPNSIAQDRGEYDNGWGQGTNYSSYTLLDGSPGTVSVDYFYQEKAGFSGTTIAGVSTESNMRSVVRAWALDYELDLNLLKSNTTAFAAKMRILNGDLTFNGESPLLTVNLDLGTTVFEVGTTYTFFTTQSPRVMPESLYSYLGRSAYIQLPNNVIAEIEINFEAKSPSADTVVVRPFFLTGSKEFFSQIGFEVIALLPQGSSCRPVGQIFEKDRIWGLLVDTQFDVASTGGFQPSRGAQSISWTTPGKIFYTGSRNIIPTSTKQIWGIEEWTFNETTGAISLVQVITAVLPRLQPATSSLRVFVESVGYYGN